MKRLINAIKLLGFGQKKIFGLDPTGIFSFFSSVCQENANNLFWFDLKHFLYHSWNMKCHCLPRSTHQLPGTLFLGELRRSRGLRETILSCCQEGWCGVWAFWSQEGWLGAVVPTVPSGQEANVGRSEIFFIRPKEKINKIYYLHSQDLPCLEAEGQSLLKHSSVPKDTITSWQSRF